MPAAAALAQRGGDLWSGLRAKNPSAQYGGFETLADMEEKVGQFPKGTQFAMGDGGAVNGAAAEIRKYAAVRGLAMVAR